MRRPGGGRSRGSFELCGCRKKVASRSIGAFGSTSRSVRRPPGRRSGRVAPISSSVSKSPQPCLPLEHSINTADMRSGHGPERRQQSRLRSRSASRRCGVAAGRVPGRCRAVAVRVPGRCRTGTAASPREPRMRRPPKAPETCRRSPARGRRGGEVESLFRSGATLLASARVKARHRVRAKTQRREGAGHLPSRSDSSSLVAARGRRTPPHR